MEVFEVFAANLGQMHAIRRIWRAHSTVMLHIQEYHWLIFDTTAAAALHISSVIIISIISGPNSCALTRLASLRAWRPWAQAVQNCVVTKRGMLGHNSLGRPERTYHTRKYYYVHYLFKPHSAKSSLRIRFGPRCASWTISRERDEPTPLWPYYCTKLKK